MTLEFKMNLSYKQNKNIKKMFGQLKGREIAFGRALCEMIKSKYSQPERLNPETCDHSGINIMIHLDEKSKRCSKCGSIFTRCDSLISVVTQRGRSEEVSPPSQG
jgi:hypothetical protein